MNGMSVRFGPPPAVTQYPAVRVASHDFAPKNWLDSMPKTGLERILVMRNMGLGDVLMVTPIIRHLAQLGRVVHMATEPRYMVLFDHNPYVSEILDINTVDRSQYIYTLDFREYAEQPWNQEQHRVKAFADGCHIELNNYNLDYFISPEEAATVPAIPSNFITFVWSSSTSARNWNLKTLQANIKALCDDGWIIGLLHQEEIDPGFSHVNLRNMSGKLSLREVALMINASACTITPDTGLFHLASALGKKIIAYFGSFPVEDRQTHGNVFLVNQPEKQPCYPCRAYHCPYMAGTTKCAPCLEVSAAQLLQKVHEVCGKP